MDGDAGTVVEACKVKKPGTMGHIAIGTNDVDRAIYHLERQGVKFMETDKVVDKDTGKTKAVYIDGEFGGFAIHLVKN